MKTAACARMCLKQKNLDSHAFKGISDFIIKLWPFPACSQRPVQEDANVFLFESLLNLEGSMSPGRHTVGIKEHLTAVTGSPRGMFT